MQVAHRCQQRADALGVLERAEVAAEVCRAPRSASALLRAARAAGRRAGPRRSSLDARPLHHQLLEQAVDERKRYVFSSQDEILATSIQILSIVATSVGQQSPSALEQGMAQARLILAERGLLGGEDIP